MSTSEGVHPDFLCGWSCHPFIPAMHAVRWQFSIVVLVYWNAIQSPKESNVDGKALIIHPSSSKAESTYPEFQKKQSEQTQKVTTNQIAHDQEKKNLTWTPVHTTNPLLVETHAVV